MKNSYAKAIMAFSFFAFAQRANAQQDVGNLFVSGPEDATELVNAYLDPLTKASDRA